MTKLRIQKQALIAMSALVIPVSVSSQVPAPPPLPGQIEMAQKLIRALETKDAKTYEALLADNVEVIVDGQRKAVTKADWLRIFAPKLTTKGTQFRIESAYESTGRIVLIEHFESYASWNRSPPPACCSSYDVSAYDVRGGKIVRIAETSGGRPMPVR